MRSCTEHRLSDGSRLRCLQVLIGFALGAAASREGGFATLGPEAISGADHAIALA